MDHYLQEQREDDLERNNRMQDRAHRELIDKENAEIEQRIRSKRRGSQEEKPAEDREIDSQSPLVNGSPTKKGKLSHTQIFHGNSA